MNLIVNNAILVSYTVKLKSNKECFLEFYGNVYKVLENLPKIAIQSDVFCKNKDQNIHGKYMEIKLISFSVVCLKLYISQAEQIGYLQSEVLTS